MASGNARVPLSGCLHGAAYHQGPLRVTQPAPTPTSIPTPSHPARYGINFRFSHPLTFIGQCSAGISPTLPLTAQGLGKRLCLMCWQFHLTLLSLISLASSLLSVAGYCLQPLHFLPFLQPPQAPTASLLLPLMPMQRR